MTSQALQHTINRLEGKPLSYNLLLAVAKQLDRVARCPSEKNHASYTMRRCATFVVEKLCWQSADLIERSAEIPSGNVDFCQQMEDKLKPALLDALRSIASEGQDHNALSATDRLLDSYYKAESELGRQ